METAAIPGTPIGDGRLLAPAWHATLFIAVIAIFAIIGAAFSGGPSAAHAHRSSPIPLHLPLIALGTGSYAAPRGVCSGPEQQSMIWSLVGDQKYGADAFRFDLTSFLGAISLTSQMTVSRGGIRDFHLLIFQFPQVFGSTLLIAAICLTGYYVARRQGRAGV